MSANLAAFRVIMYPNRNAAVWHGHGVKFAGQCTPLDSFFSNNTEEFDVMATSEEDAIDIVVAFRAAHRIRRT